MAEQVKIELDADILAEKVTNALVTSLVGRMVSGIITNKVISEEKLTREYERAVEEVAHAAFVDYLKNDSEFQKKLHEMVEKTATEQFLKEFLEKMQRQVRW